MRPTTVHVLALALLADACGRAELRWDDGPPGEPRSTPVRYQNEPGREVPPRGRTVTFRELAPDGLALPEPGVLLVRTQAEWRALWRLGTVPPADPPPVDFGRHMVAVVSFGTFDSCYERFSFVRRVEQTADSLRVMVYHRELSSVCDSLVNGITLALLPRTDLPVAFVPAAMPFGVPGPGPWLGTEG